MTNEKLIKFANDVLAITDTENFWDSLINPQYKTTAIQALQFRKIQQLANALKEPIWNPIPEYGDLMTIQNFRECVEQGGFTDDDGSGYFATATQMSDEPISCQYDFSPALKHEPINPVFTHVVWFNK